MKRVSVGARKIGWHDHHLARIRELCRMSAPIPTGIYNIGRAYDGPLDHWDIEGSVFRFLGTVGSPIPRVEPP